MVRKTILALIIMSFGMSAQAAQEPPVSMTTASYQQITLKNKKGKILRDKKGKPIKKWVKATKVVPGYIVKYVDTVTNRTDEPLSDLKISNPINENLVFVDGSAKSKAKFSVKYSVDGGKSYDVPKNLFAIGKNKKKRQAIAKDYNAILFVIDEVPAQSEVKAEFKVKLK